MTLDLLWDSSSPADLALSGDDVHVWCASLDQPATRFRRLVQTLSADERARAERFHFEQDGRRFTVGRGLLRTILGSYLGVEPSQLQFCYGCRGKPALASGGGTLRFNLSHSQDLALYAVTRDRAIGIDLECIRPISETEEVAERFFSAREIALLRALPVSISEKREAFFNCWTRKEAYTKASGDGLTRPLDQIEVSLAPGEPARLLCIKGDPREATRWLLHELRPASGYVATLVVEGHGWRLACRQWAG